jgi:hypothetical protein
LDNSSEEDKKSNYVEIAGQTGTENKVRLTLEPFFAVQTLWVNDKSLADYGWDPQSAAYVVRIVYRPLNQEGKMTAEPTVVAGYISPRNVNLSEIEKDGTYKIGVAIDDVIATLEARVKVAENVRPTTYSEGSYDETVNIDNSIERLNEIISDLKKKSEEQKIKYFVLARGSRQTFASKETVDKLEINEAFFDRFYPAFVFPIGREADCSWINRDCLLNGLFLEKEKQEDKAINLENNEFLKKTKKEKNGESDDRENFPSLKTSFTQFNETIIQKENSKETSEDEQEDKALKDQKNWPNLQTIVEQFNNELKKEPAHQGSQVGDFIDRALEWASKFQFLAKRLNRNHRCKEAEEYENAALEITDIALKSCCREQKRLIENLKLFEDVDSDALLIHIDAIHTNSGQLQRFGDYEDLPENFTITNQAHACIASKLDARMQKFFEKLKHLDPEKDEYLKKINQIVDDRARLLTLQIEENKIYDMYDVARYLAIRWQKLFDNLKNTNPNLSEYGEKIFELMRELANPALNSFDSIVIGSQNEKRDFRTSDSSFALVRMLAKKSSETLIENFEKTSVLDDNLRRLLRMHVFFIEPMWMKTERIKCPVPEQLIINSEISDFVAKLYAEKEQKSRERTPDVAGSKRKDILGDAIDCP